jgi:4-hydroxy-tetrahydrodipicolinate reductase
MKIALIGYGKMGKAIEEIALQRGHTITHRITSSNKNELSSDNLKEADVAIEFTNPEAAKENVMLSLQAGVPTVCGTTGWNNEMPEVRTYVAEHNGSFLQASNFSVGVNIFFAVNKYLAMLMNDQPQYDVTIDEIHHTQKKDAPSGTAITLAEQVLENLTRKTKWVKDQTTTDDELAITSQRLDNYAGTHNVKYSSAIDDIEIIHTAHSRAGFAHGAVLAAEYIADKKGNFTMKDVLGIS